MLTLVVTPRRLAVFNYEQSAELVYLPNVVFRLYNRPESSRPYATLLTRALSTPFGSVVSAGPARKEDDKLPGRTAVTYNIMLLFPRYCPGTSLYLWLDRSRSLMKLYSINAGRRAFKPPNSPSQPTSGTDFDGPSFPVPQTSSSTRRFKTCEKN